MRILVAGALANKPGYGGEAWVRLAWIKGLRALGIDVMFVETLHPEPGEGAGGRPRIADPRVAWFVHVTTEHGLADRCVLLDAGGAALVGPDRDALLDHAEGAELLVNLSGHLPAGPLFDGVRRRSYVDLDPGYTQIWHADGAAHLRLAEHDVHFTVGTNVGRPGCPIPAGGLRWLPVLPPVVLDDWPVTPVPEDFRFTSVASWRGAFGPVHIGERSFGPKAHQFRRIMHLPRHLPVPLELALDIHPGDEADRRRLLEAGWRLVDPAAVADTPEAFRHYVQGSGGELSAAQSVYVETGCGWFSDRSAHYLATGRPVVVQDTGFGRTLPTGEGLLTFGTPDEAIDDARRVVADPARHARAARALAEEHLAGERVLSRFVDQATAGRTGRTGRSAVTAPPRSILVGGMVAGAPGQGGATWAVLQYVLGLLHLGYDAYLVEEVAADAPGLEAEPFDRSPAATYFREVTRRFGLEGRAALVHAGTGRTVGLDRDALAGRLRRTELLLNLSGSLRTLPHLDAVPLRVYLDLDPGFTQVWAAQGALDLGLDRHTHFATVGLGVGRPGCAVPTAGLDWIPTLPPVCLEEWPEGAPAPARDAWTTIGHWRAYGSVEWNGERWGQKAHAVRELMTLPRRSGDAVEIALGIHPDEVDDLRALRASGWTLLDPDEVAGDPERYRRFVRESAAELGLTKAGYVRSRSGWFSDRSACYLAAGRPVVAHDTGFSEYLPVSAGLLAFDDLDGAVEAMAAVRAEYPRHRRAARGIAEHLLSTRRVLPRLLREVDACARPA